MSQNSMQPNTDGNKQLSFLKREAAPGSVNPWLLVLMHGVGSNEQDLFGLAPSVPANFHVVSLRAPNVVGPGSYAWFQFGITPQGQRVINKAQEAASRQLIAETVSALSQQLGVRPERVVIGGFSQGGIMALSLLLTQPQLVQGAMVLHSRLLDALDANLEWFGRESAQALEYWLDVSRFSKWKKPAVRLPWNPDVVTADLNVYASRGVRHITSFAVYIDADYVRQYGEPPIRDYGKLLQSAGGR